MWASMYNFDLPSKQADLGCGRTRYLRPFRTCRLNAHLTTTRLGDGDAVGLRLYYTNNWMAGAILNVGLAIVQVDACACGFRCA